MEQERKRFGIVVSDKLWWNGAVKGWVKVFHSPPNRGPGTR